MGGGTRAEARGVERLPLATRAQDEEDRVQAHAVGGAWLATAKGMRVHMFGDQPGDFFPQLVGDAPLIVRCREGHESVS